MKPSMGIPKVTLADWRAQVDKELAGVAFDKALVHTTPEGLAIQPLYVAPEQAAEPGLPGAAPFVRGASAHPAPFQVCMRVDAAASRREEALAEDLGGGADALWLEAGDDAALQVALGHGLGVVVDAGELSAEAAFEWLAARAGSSGSRVQLGLDPISAVARGALAAERLSEAVAAVAAVAASARSRLPAAQVVRVSSLPFHVAGADAADELALMLSTGVAYLRALEAAGIEVAAAAGLLAMQISVGRDTFGELCKLRALRLCWHKVLAAAGAPEVAMPSLHAVCSPRTQSQRDPWVNMLRVTTEVFAAALGGADLVTPLSFDEALGEVSSHGRRVARNTALVLREESHLGRVVDPGGGAYYVEARTEQLAREAWSRFAALERDGGVAKALTTGALRQRLDAAWAKRAAAIGRRKEPVLGVSEFANLDEKLPAAARLAAEAPPAPALAAHRDAEAFERLRAKMARAPREVVLSTLGPAAEHRGRAAYAAAFFATAGLRPRESGDAPARADIACLCGSDERYAAEAVTRAAELKAAGCRRVVLAGRPGELEPALRAAGVDTFIFVGCDVVGTLTELIGADV